MKNRCFSKIPLIFLVLLNVQCRNSVTEDNAIDFPKKLFPYAVSFDSSLFAERRQRLLQQMEPGGWAIITTNSEYLRNGDVEYEFRPSSYFYYLTGFEEPNAVAILHKYPDAGSQYFLFVETRDSAKTQLLGPVLGPERAKYHFGADSAFSISELSNKWESMVIPDSAIGIYSNLSENKAVLELFNTTIRMSRPTRELSSLVDGLRFIKDAHETELIQKSVEVSVQAIQTAIPQVHPNLFEFEVESILDQVLKVNGCPRTAFTPIIASGPNITTIHYTENQREMKSGDLVLIDFGSEYGYYAADLARTLPVNGSFDPTQAAIYDLVLKAQDSIIALVRPGVDFMDLIQVNWKILMKGLVDLGVIQGTEEEIFTSKRYLDYAPTGLGHPIGLDVHDPLIFDSNSKALLKEGVFLAIEPGIYLKPDDSTVAAKYRGITVRIEDDIRVTATGHELLSSRLPRTRNAIENAMKRP